MTCRITRTISATLPTAGPARRFPSPEYRLRNVRVVARRSRETQPLTSVRKRHGAYRKVLASHTIFSVHHTCRICEKRTSGAIDPRKKMAPHHAAMQSRVSGTEKKFGVHKQHSKPRSPPNPIIGIPVSHFSIVLLGYGLDTAGRIIPTYPVWRKLMLDC